MVRRIPRSVVIGLAVFALVILPFVLWGDRFDAWAHALLDHEPRGLMPPLVCIALLAGDVVLPVPSSLVSTAAGYWWGLWGGALVVMLGMTLGSWLGYVLGAQASGLRRWMGEGEAERMHRLFARHGEWIVVMLRPVPVLAEASAVFAGFSRMEPRRYAVMSLAANACLAMFYGAAGALLGKSERGASLFVLLVVLAAVTFVVRRLPRGAAAS